MNDEILLSIRNQLLINRALALRSVPDASDPPEDLEESGITDPDGAPVMRLKYTAALRLAVKEHMEGSKIIQSFLEELAKPG